MLNSPHLSVQANAFSLYQIHGATVETCISFIQLFWAPLLFYRPTVSVIGCDFMNGQGQYVVVPVIV